MKHFTTSSIHSFFKVLASTRSSQAAMMTLKPGQSTGEYSNEHPESEQWVFIISGHCRARVRGRSIKLKSGSLLLIEKGEPHQITNTGSTPLHAVSFYSPPAYTASGELRSDRA